ncbi:MAG: hypothetical protein DRP93_08460 [Candidatus Neomarinimicrobiota bacterium]|nr:MAG: hypothetical protein DRP93_08460 [Candidatus Neomarinimicrobiota bacterium]
MLHFRTKMEPNVEGGIDPAVCTILLPLTRKHMENYVGDSNDSVTYFGYGTCLFPFSSFGIFRRPE